LSVTRINLFVVGSNQSLTSYIGIYRVYSENFPHKRFRIVADGPIEMFLILPTRLFTKVTKADESRKSNRSLNM